MSIVTMPLILENGTQQIVKTPGGFPQSTFLYIGFQSAPSAGEVLIEGQRPGSTEWMVIYQGAASGAQTMCSGGYGPLRVTFSGLSGGSSPSVSAVAAQTVSLPFLLTTDGGYGPSSRIKVDPGQTGLFAGKFFRNYVSAVIPTPGGTLQLRFTSPVNFILWSQTLTLTQGALELRAYTGATGSGTWSDLSPIGLNRMTTRPQPYYEPQSRLSTGGSFTGGSEVDLIQVRTSAQNATASNIYESASERGLPAGTYFLRIQTLTGGVTVNDAAQMIYSLVWEERP